MRSSLTLRLESKHTDAIEAILLYASMPVLSRKASHQP
jgi:hypothetical protein